MRFCSFFSLEYLFTRTTNKISDHNKSARHTNTHTYFQIISLYTFTTLNISYLQKKVINTFSISSVTSTTSQLNSCGWYRLTQTHWYLLETPTGDTYWRYLLETPTGDTYWRYLLEIPTGDTYWRYLLEIPTGDTYWRHLLEIPTGDTYWRYLLEIVVTAQ